VGDGGRPVPPPSDRAGSKSRGAAQKTGMQNEPQRQKMTPILRSLLEQHREHDHQRRTLVDVRRPKDLSNVQVSRIKNKDLS
jgi:hypothetical protein